MNYVEIPHPYGKEAPHDDDSTAAFQLAADMLRSNEPGSLIVPSTVDGFRQIVASYVGDTSVRDSTMLPSKSQRETKNGPRNYTLGCVTMVDPHSAELCMVLKDKNAHSDDVTDWLIVRYDIFNRTVREDAVLSAVTKREDSGDEIELSLAPDRMGIGSYQLQFKLNETYDKSGIATLSHRKYYGRGTGSVPESVEDKTYSISVDSLMQKIVESERDIVHSSERHHSANDLHVATLGHVALEIQEQPLLAA